MIVPLSKLKPDIRAVFAAVLESANPYKSILKCLKRKGRILRAGKYGYNLSCFHHIYVFGAGKAALLMAQAAKKVLGRYLAGGIVCIPDNYPIKTALNKIKIRVAAHPIPNKSSQQAALGVREMLKTASTNDFVIYLASGGGSSLLVLPAPGITLKDLQQLTGLLLKSGASLNEMNTVRKHIDMVKGGWLARHAYPASLLTLVLSDVVGDKIEMVSSGPTLPDTSTFKDAHNILMKYGLGRKIPRSIRERIKSGLIGGVSDTPKPGDICFLRNQAVLIGTNRLALESARSKAESLGYHAIVLPLAVTGEACVAAYINAGKAVQLAKRRIKPLLIISGGETTVSVKGSGIGGRNQEYALAFAIRMKELNFRNFVCLSCSTDGIDNVKGVAGAIVDGTSIDKAVAKGLNPNSLLKNNNSYRFHKAINSLVKTGPTGTNVNDIQITAVW
ncbi:MAG: DUF4147 domain-containing protein [Planctomycetota bacterium]